MVDIVGRAVKGVGGGLVATGVEALLTAAQAGLRGRRAVYDPSNLALNLARRYFGITLSHDGARRAGQVMRWSYGPTWGVLLAAVMGAREPARAWPVWGLGLGAAVLGFELIMLPATGATPPVSSWRARELELEVLNTMAFGIAAAAFLRAMPPGRAPGRLNRWRPGSRAAG